MAAAWFLPCYAPNSYGRMTRLQYERQQRGLSQAAVCERIAHLHQPMLSQIEIGRLVPTPAQLDALARFFNVNPPERLLEKGVIVREVVQPDLDLPAEERRPVP
jgi:transcriptional regulator with XRE-family HTH domain